MVHCKISISQMPTEKPAEKYGKRSYHLPSNFWVNQQVLVGLPSLGEAVRGGTRRLDLDL